MNLRIIFQKLTCLFIVIIFLAAASQDLAAQKKNYTGKPVTQKGLVEVLRSKKYQAGEIVEVIAEQGVNFRLTPTVRTELIAAGARPEVIAAVEKNYRGAAAKTTGVSTGAKSYEDLLEQAVRQFDVEKNAGEAVKSLNAAVKLRPEKPRAYQLLGYMNLYGFENFGQAEKYMREAVSRGGSAVFRVRHAHDVTFSYSCIGSLYITKSRVRFEGDSNEHTFNVPDSDIAKIKTVGGLGKILQRKGGTFQIVIRDRSEAGDKDKYNFSPLTGEDEESKMIIRLINK